MAEHPHRYGQYPSQYSPVAAFPPMPSSSNPQTPYYYQTPQAGAMPPVNYTVAQSAYDHNSTRIPGLGLGGNPMAPIPSFPSTAPQPWPAQGHNPQMSSYFQSQKQPSASLPQLPLVAHQQSQNTLEEGELGEGELEDLYEPNNMTDAPQAPLRNKPTEPQNSLDSRNSSVGDADGSSIYDPHDPHVSHQERLAQATPHKSLAAEQEYPPDDEWEPSYPDRERSGSYSPHLSPREVHRKLSVAKAAHRDAKTFNQAEPSQSTRSVDSSLPITSNVMVHPNGTASASLDASGNDVAASTTSYEHHTNGSLPFRSPLEAKKKAQEAILGLWPLKVRYQDYIDEGVDADVVRSLFKAIGLAVPVPKTTTAPVEAAGTAPVEPTTVAVSSNASPKPQSPHPNKMQASPPSAKQDEHKDGKDRGNDAKMGEKSASEERKDKIARKLAAMAQKTTPAQPVKQGVSANTPVSTPAPVPISAPSPAPILAPASLETSTSVGANSNVTRTPPPTTKTRAENNAILQQRLAALRKQQAQSAADKARTIVNESITTASPPPEVPGSLDSSHSDSTPRTRSAASAHQNTNQRDSPGTPQGNSKPEGIPGLSLSSLAFPQPATEPVRTLKRPVASDFDNYTPRFEPQKRTRTEETLVIDVSDDEDVEMEIGSPTDEFPPSTDSSTPSARQVSSAFPPLSDGPNGRQRESPALGSGPAPPVHGARIDLLHKRIEETKRLIAEAEAKKAAKRAAAHLSPKPSSPTARQLASPSIVNDNNVEDKKAINERRDKIVSYELPRITATLKEKQDKLKILVAQAAQLELEVQASLEEQQKLRVEMECLGESSMEISPEPEQGQQPQSRGGKYTEPESQPPGQAMASNDQQGLGGERLELQLSHRRKSPSVDVSGDMDAELNNDDALQAAILTDNNCMMDHQMADAEMPSPTTDDAPVIDRASTTGIASDAPEASGLVLSPGSETEQAQKGSSINAESEVGSMSESAPQVMSVQSSESDVGSSESDVSMQQSAPESSQSDDESYEPIPDRISDSHGAPNNAEVMKYSPPSTDGLLTKCQVADDILEEPNPNHTLVNGNRQEPQSTSNEVKSRSYEEPLLLTTPQDVQTNRPPMEDLLSYKSPLSYFRAYRFHPKFFEEVPGGLKSMTFSARIDPMREVCPQVLAGEPCPRGPSCEYQHFDSMVLQDAEIITQLGSAEMFVGETRIKFIEGLRRLLNELKANRIKDFDRITKAIVKYRQDFLDDKTKVLALDSSAT